MSLARCVHSAEMNFPPFFSGVITVLVRQVGNNEDAGRGRRTTLYSRYYNVNKFDVVYLTKKWSM